MRQLKGLAAVAVAAIGIAEPTSGCAVLFTKPYHPPAQQASAPSSPDDDAFAAQPQQGALPQCSQSNWWPGVDLLLSALSLVAIAGIANDVNAGSDGNPGVGGEVVLGGVAALTFASMVYGLTKTSECRSATAAAGFAPRGASDWLLPLAILLTAGGAALLAADPDRCGVGQLVTAVCNDGTPSCSANRSGTCSHHGGVSYWE